MPESELEVMLASVHAKSSQSCPALWDCILPGSSVHGILQARILERFAIFSSRGSSWPRNPNQFIRTPQRCCTGGWRDSYVRDVSGQTVLTLCLMQLGLCPWRKELACPAPPFSFLFLYLLGWAGSSLQHVEALVAGCRIWFSNKGANLGPLCWECTILAAEPPGKGQAPFLWLMGRCSEHSL